MSGAPPYMYSGGRPTSTATSSGGGGGVGALLRELHIPWPAANEGDLQAAAAIWHQLAETIRDGNGVASSTANGLTSNNEGTAIQAFEKYWSKFGGSSGALPALAEGCDALSSACSKYAAAVAETKSKIEQAGAEVAATLILGTIGAFFTFGATEGIADSVAAGLLATVAGYIDDLTGIAGGIITDFSTTLGWAVANAGDVIADAVESDASFSVAKSVLGGTISGISSNIASDAGTDMVNHLFGDQPMSPEAVAKSLVVGGVAGGATGGLIGGLSKLGVAQVQKLLTKGATSVAVSDPQAAMTMLALSKSLEGRTGQLPISVVNSVASQLILSQQISAEALVKGQVGGQLKQLLQSLGKEEP